MERILFLSRTKSQPLSTHEIASHAESGQAEWRHAEWRHAEWRVEQNQTMSFVAAPEGKLLCVSGTAWITQSGDTRDYILHAGETLSLKSGAKVVLQSLTEAAILRQT